MLLYLVPDGRREKRVVRVRNDGDCSAYAALLVDLLHERERGTNNSDGTLNNPVELSLVLVLVLVLVLGPAAAIPGCETVFQDVSCKM